MSFQGYTYVGDPVDVIKYNVAKYQGSVHGSHFCDIDLSRDEVRECFNMCYFYLKLIYYVAISENILQP